MLLAVFLALGCGAPKSRTPVVVKAVEVPAAPPFIAPGERISFRVNLHEVTLASFALVAGDIEMVAGHKAIVVQAGAQSEGLAAMVKPVKAEFTSWIDVETGAPVMFRAVEAAGRGDETIERVEARFTEKTGNAFAITTTPADQAPLEQQQTTTSIPSDLIAMLVSLRGWDGKPGEQRTVDAMRSRFMWRVKISTGERTAISTDLGQLPAVQLDAESRRINRDGSLDTGTEPRKFSIWISADADRVPLLLVAETDYGDIRMEIVDYSAGTGANLATGSSGG